MVLHQKIKEIREKHVINDKISFIDELKVKLVVLGDVMAISEIAKAIKEVNV